MDDGISSEINNFLIQTNGADSTFKECVQSSINFDVPSRLHKAGNLKVLTKEINKSDQKRIVLDEDGDIMVSRICDNKSNPSSTLIIEHQISTNLDNVGRQLWRGAFYLADYLFELSDKNVINELCTNKKGSWLEIGAGTGFLAIVSYIVKRKQPESTSGNIFVTDLSDVLPLTRNNIKSNIAESCDMIKLVPLDLKEGKIPSEIAKTEVSLLLAADIIYDDILTYSIVQTLHGLIIQQYDRAKLMEMQKTKNILTCLFSIERRINFTVANLKVSAPAYDYFIECLNELNNNMAKLNITLDISYITLDDKSQWFCYQRCKDLVIVKIDVLLLNN